MAKTTSFQFGPSEHVCLIDRRVNALCVANATIPIQAIDPVCEALEDAIGRLPDTQGRIITEERIGDVCVLTRPADLRADMRYAISNVRNTPPDTAWLTVADVKDLIAGVRAYVDTEEMEVVVAAQNHQVPGVVSATVVDLLPGENSEDAGWRPRI